MGYKEELEKFLDALMQHESGGKNVPNAAGISSASGYYQYINSTWNNYKGYKRAIDAPYEVQRQRAREDAERAYKKFGSWDKVAANHFYPAWANDKSKWSKSPSPGNPTINKYVSSIMNKMGQSFDPPKDSGPSASAALGEYPEVEAPEGVSAQTRTAPRQGRAPVVPRAEHALPSLLPAANPQDAMAQANAEIARILGMPATMAGALVDTAPPSGDTSPVSPQSSQEPDVAVFTQSSTGNTRARTNNPPSQRYASRTAKTAAVPTAPGGLWPGPTAGDTAAGTDPRTTPSPVAEPGFGGIEAALGAEPEQLGGPNVPVVAPAPTAPGAAGSTITEQLGDEMSGNVPTPGDLASDPSLAPVPGAVAPSEEGPAAAPSSGGVDGTTAGIGPGAFNADPLLALSGLLSSTSADINSIPGNITNYFDPELMVRLADLNLTEDVATRNILDQGVSLLLGSAEQRRRLGDRFGRQQQLHAANAADRGFAGTFTETQPKEGRGIIDMMAADLGRSQGQSLGDFYNNVGGELRSLLGGLSDVGLGTTNELANALLTGTVGAINKDLGAQLEEGNIRRLV